MTITATPSRQPRVLSERTVVSVIAAVQFVNILDFMMVMPLGPDFAIALNIPTSQIGLLGGSYTAAAAVSGMAGSLFLDRFDRRKVLGVTLTGLAIGTACGGLAHGLTSLLLARVVAGTFGGPATSIALAIATDAVPVARRGRALGAVMAAFSLASILGVPVGLELARWFGWRAPFFGIAALALVFTVAAYRILPPMTGHLGRPLGSAAPALPEIGTALNDSALNGSALSSSTLKDTKSPKLFQGLALLSLFNTALVMLSVFSVVPNISAFLQRNLGYPREHLGILYLVGGAASFLASRVCGSLVDRFGATKLILAGTLLYASALVFSFIDPVSADHVLYVFPLMMMSATVRGVPMQTLASRVPAPTQRARFMSAQSSVQHLASAVGAGAASFALVANPDGSLIGMDKVAIVAIGLAMLVPFLAARLEREVTSRERSGATSRAPHASTASR